MASYVDWIWYRIINGLSWKQFSSPQLAGFLLIFPSNSVEGDKRPSVHCHLMAFWPPSDPVGLPGTWIQVMKRMPNTMKCHEMPWCYGKRPTISFLVLTWLTCVFWPWKVLSLCPLFLDFPMCFPGGAVNTSLDLPTASPAPRPTWWLWTTHWLPKPCRGTGTRGGSRKHRMVSRSISSIELVFDDESCFTKQISISDPWNWVDPAWVAMNIMNGREARCFWHTGLDVFFMVQCQGNPDEHRCIEIGKDRTPHEARGVRGIDGISHRKNHRKTHGWSSTGDNNWTVGWAEPRLLISSC